MCVTRIRLHKPMQWEQLANIIELLESASDSGHSKFGLIKIAWKE